MGALVSKEHLIKVLSYIQIAKDEGGTIVTGGEQLAMAGYFMRPTIITGLHPTQSRVQKEEIFGPVVTISKFKTDDEAVEFANATQYGLSCSIWTQNVSRAHGIAQRIHAGTVWINVFLN